MRAQVLYARGLSILVAIEHDGLTPKAGAERIAHAAEVGREANGIPGVLERARRLSPASGGETESHTGVCH